MSAEGPLWVICDCSGSMSEPGKRLLMRGLVAYLQQAERLWYSQRVLRVIRWSEAAETLELDCEADAPLWPCSGAAQADALAGALSRILAQTPNARVLLLSDGQWTARELAHLMAWRASQPALALQLVAVGSDANWRVLKKLGGESAIHPAEEIARAAGAWPDRAEAQEKGALA